MKRVLNVTTLYCALITRRANRISMAPYYFQICNCINNKCSFFLCKVSVIFVRLQPKLNLVYNSLAEVPSIKFHEDPYDGSRYFPCGQTDGPTRFFGERPWKMNTSYGHWGHKNVHNSFRKGPTDRLRFSDFSSFAAFHCKNSRAFNQ